MCPATNFTVPPKLAELDTAAFEQSSESNAAMNALMDELEKHRHKQRREIRTRTIISLLSALIFIFYFFFYSQEMTPNETMQIGLGVFILLGIWSRAPIYTYKKIYKKNFMPNLAYKLGGLTYKTVGHISLRKILGSGLMSREWVYKGEDYFKGKYQKREIEISQGMIQNPMRRDHKNPKQSQIMFQGLIVRLSLLSPVKGYTFATMRRGSKSDKETNLQTGLEDVRTLYPENENIVDIYTNSKAEIRELLPLAVMKQFSTISQTFENAPIEVSIHNKDIVIFIPYEKKMFNSVNINRPAFSTTDMPLLQILMKSLVGIATTLDKHRNTPKGQKSSEEAA